MTPDPQTRDALFKAFGGAFFRQDMDAMYEVVTEGFTWSILVGDEVRVVDSRSQVAAFLEERRASQKDVRFEDVVYHHADEATFMTYRMTGTDVATGESFASIGIERYTFEDGKIAVKDVYSRPDGVSLSCP